VYTPTHLYIFVHDGKIGFSTAGKSTTSRGRLIRIYGPRKVVCWKKASEVILAKLTAACGAPVYTYCFAEPVKAIEAILAYKTQTAKVFTGAPLSEISSGARGDLFELVVKHLDVGA